MLPQKRIKSLEDKKAILARQIEDEERSPSVDTTILRHLKKQKLELNEIIQGIREDRSSMH